MNWLKQAQNAAVEEAYKTIAKENLTRTMELLDKQTSPSAIKYPYEQFLIAQDIFKQGLAAEGRRNRIEYYYQSALRSEEAALVLHREYKHTHVARNGLLVFAVVILLALIV